MDESGVSTDAAAAPREGEGTTDGRGSGTGTGATNSGGAVESGGESTVASCDAGMASEAAGNTPAVNLRTAGAFVLLSKGGLSTVPPAAILGDLLELSLEGTYPRPRR